MHLLIIADSVQRHGSGASVGDNIFCELSAAQTAERQSFLAKMKHSAMAGRFPLAVSGVVATDPVDYQPNLNVVDLNTTHATNVARYRLSQRPVARSLDTAAAATAQAMANFQALIDEGRRSLSLFQATNSSGIGTTQGYASTPFLSAQRSLQQQQQQQVQVQSNYGPFGAPSFRATENHFNSGIGNQFGVENLSGFGANSNTNGHRRVEVNATSGDANWPNLSCEASMSNASRSLVETNSVGESESPRTPRGHQRMQHTVISDVHQEYLRHEERLNAIATDPDSPRQNSSRGRRLSYAAPQERPASSIFYGHEPVPADDHIQGENHVHIYLDPVEVPKHVDDWTSVSTEVDKSHALPEPTGFGVGDVVECRGQQEMFTQSFESAPVVAPAESHFGSGEKFDLNEVPVGVGEAATPKPARKKYHPRVQKDKRTYKRRVDGKKVPASPMDAGNLTSTSLFLLFFKTSCFNQYVATYLHIFVLVI